MLAGQRPYQTKARIQKFQTTGLWPPAHHNTPVGASQDGQWRGEGVDSGKVVDGLGGAGVAGSQLVGVEVAQARDVIIWVPVTQLEPARVIII